jgi:transcriptional regulator with XRE-family HTH domain
LEIEEKIGIRLKEIRLEKKITQEALSQLAGMERTFISHIEKGNRNISVATLNKLLRALDISFASFFNSDYFKQKL